jgi:hypothetical protein
MTADDLRAVTHHISGSPGRRVAFPGSKNVGQMVNSSGDTRFGGPLAANLFTTLSHTRQLRKMDRYLVARVLPAHEVRSCHHLLISSESVTALADAATGRQVFESGDYHCAMA